MPTPSASIRAVIFDYGNVLSAVDNGRIAAALAPVCGRSAEDLAARFRASGLPFAYESGALDSAGFLAGISDLCGMPLPEPVFLRAFTDIFEPLAATRQLVRDLHGRVRLGLLSNTNPWHFEHEIRPCDVFPLFDTVTLSFEVGTLKPDPRIYRDALAKLDLPPEACAYTDDIPAFTDAARALGMQAFPFTGADVLRASLRELGLPV